MTVSVAIGLIIQFAAAGLVHLAIRGQWLTRPGAILLAVAVLHHGITEVTQWLWSGQNQNRFRFYLKDQAAIDDWMILVSAVIATYAIAYTAVALHHPPRPAATERWSGFTSIRLRWLIALIVPLLIATWTGRGALGPVSPLEAATHVNNLSASVGLADTFLVPLVAITGIVTVVRYGPRWLIPVIAAQGLVLTGSGTRSLIVTAYVLTLVGVALHGVKPSRRQIIALVVLASTFIALISAVRVAAGRQVFQGDIGASKRVEGVVEGTATIGSLEASKDLTDNIVYRFDGNTFGAGVFRALRETGQYVGATTVGNNLAMLVPSFIFPEKNYSLSLEQRNEEVYLCSVYGLDPNVDWLPTVFGAMLTYAGPVGLILLALLLGLTFAGAERVLLQSTSPVRVMAMIGLASCALQYGGGPQNVMVMLRSMAALVLATWAVSAMARGGSPRNVEART